MLNIIGRILISFARRPQLTFSGYGKIDNPGTEEIRSLDVKPLSVLFRWAFFGYYNHFGKSDDVYARCYSKSRPVGDLCGVSSFLLIFLEKQGRIRNNRDCVRLDGK